MRRRSFIRSLGRTAAIFSTSQLLSGLSLDLSFVNIARQSGLRAKTIYGGERTQKYLIETTGCGAAFFDYDHDGWLDIFLVNGSRFESLPGPAPISRLYRNNRDGTFTDVTIASGLARSGWGAGCCVGDFDNDGFDDLFVTYWGDCSLWKNTGKGKFIDVAARAGVTTRPASGAPRNNTGCAFLDYDRDGHLDLFIANYLDFSVTSAPAAPCKYKGLTVACGPPGLKGGRNILYRNRGDGTFEDVSASSGILTTSGTFALGVLTGDFDNDGWPDIYVANDSTPATLYRNNHDGTFTDTAVESGVAYSADGKPQAGMGVSAADYDGDGHLDIVKTNFAGDTTSLYHATGDGFFEDTAFPSGLSRITRYLGWGAGFIDFDNDGRPDILLANGHVYPEIHESPIEAGYRQRKLAWHNLGNGRFAEIGATLGPGLNDPVSARGMAIGDFDNDGDLDILINTINDYPQLLRCNSRTGHNWLKVKLTGTRSNRSAIGARVICTTPTGHRQVDEVRSGGSYLSQSDLRLHFGLGPATSATLDIRWPSGLTERHTFTKVNRIVTITEKV
jgi:enediyne biosynthesis protein E4